MKIFDNIEIIEPYPAIYIEEIDAIVIADLHLGYEGIMAEQGVFIPKVQFKKEMEMLSHIFEMKGAKRMIINGDVKHEFSETTYHEFKEVKDLFEFLKSRFEEVSLVKGNHDNFIIYMTRKYGIELHDELVVGDFLFVHGHKIPRDLQRIEASFVVIGHEHPALVLYDEVGAKEKLNCFLFGGMEGNRKILVMPAFSYFAYGSDVNLMPKEELLSPILRKLVDIDKLEVMGISEETGCLDFLELGKLRSV
ncbi:MAG: metallophosphoesterase [Candidatus Hydrothermarchaeales archaeon]